MNKLCAGEEEAWKEKTAAQNISRKKQTEFKGKKRFKKENDRDDMKIYANDEKSEICKKKN